MRLFRCQVCGQRVYFENTRCEVCDSRLGYLPEIGLMSALEPSIQSDVSQFLARAGLAELAAVAPEAAEEIWFARLRPDARYRFCSNERLDACNWMVPADGKDTLCRACRHDRQIPDLTDGTNRLRWRKLERAKHWLFYSLVKLHLPLPTRAEEAGGLAFDFLADPSGPDGGPVLTGHMNGVITIALREADDVEREKMREALGEPYRTLLGHLRHEIGHFFWVKLIRDAGRLDACRAVFGDDRADYAAALNRYYAEGPPAGWAASHVSAYATMHPWEDFAETWAHYLHMMDTLETAAAHGIKVRPRGGGPEFGADPDFDPYRMQGFSPMIDNWLPLSAAANSLTRSMGQRDFYPFVLSPGAIGKLAFVHALVQDHRVGAGTAAA